MNNNNKLVVELEKEFSAFKERIQLRSVCFTFYLIEIFKLIILFKIISQVTVGTDKLIYRYFEEGDSTKIPIVFLAPAGGAAEVFFWVFNSL